MAVSDLTLMHETLQNAQSIVIPIPEIHGIPILGSALALASLLQAEGKQVSIVSSYNHIQQVLTMIDTSMITSILQGSVESIISIDITKYPIESLKYDRTESELRIYLNSPSDKFQSESVSINAGKYPYDLVVTLDTQNWTQLGQYFTDYPHIFIDTPSLAISAFDIKHPYSEKTIYNSAYNSNAEIIIDYIKTYYPHAWNATICNALLFSLLLSEKHNLAIDKSIIEIRELGGDYDAIQSAFNSLITDSQRLLIGRILAHLEWMDITVDGEKQRYAYSKLFPHDFSKTHTKSHDIPLIYQTILSYLPADTLGLHILLDNGNSTKQGYLDFSKLDMSEFISDLDGEYDEGVLVYSYASDKDIHTAGKELNTRLIHLLEKHINK
jgi:hypothetical protein